LILLTWAIRGAQSLTGSSSLSFEWNFSVIIAALAVLMSFLIRPEAWPAIIPVIVQVVLTFLETKSFFRGFFSLIATSLALSVVAVLGLCTFVAISVIWGPPKCRFIPPAPSAIWTSVLSYPHNLVIGAVALLAIPSMLCVAAPKPWLWSLFGTSVAILFAPISGLVDDLLVRTVFAKYVLLIAAGTVFCDRRIWWFSTPGSWFLLVIAIYFFFRPIQE
jgi:hypothetical protein